MTALEFEIGVAIASAFIAGGVAVRFILRGLLDPWAQEWLARHDLPR